MCGFVGYMINEKSAIQPIVLEQMMEQIAHRGPDGSGRYYDARIALGHRRLSIIDLDGGAQPMSNEDGRYVCVFNGEIYNYKELRYQLEQKGHAFSTASDTEVLLHGYEEWKTDLPVKLRGMFAFAIWDKLDRELFCARDYFGIKPFYYYQKKDIFLFGSEIKSFLPHPQFEKQLNMEQLESYLSYQYSPGKNTFFKDVYKLAPGHWMLWSDGSIKCRSYWRATFLEKDTLTLEEWAEKIDAAMRDSVKAHKISDVEVASFLSSGVDSSYIAKLSDVKQTFTVGYADEKYDESATASDFCEKYGIENTKYYISKEEFLEKLSEIQYYMDEPLADASSSALFFLNREAAKHVKVCLSGEGADELFGGYNVYKEPYMCARYDALPLQMRSIIGRIVELLPPYPGRNFLVRHSRPLWQRYIGNTCLFSEREKRKLLRHYSGIRMHVEQANVLARIYGQDFVDRVSMANEVTHMQLVDLNAWMVGDILLKADKMSMANSLELRVPFLDKKVFEVAREIPIQYRVNADETKIALRQAAGLELDAATTERKKRGFPVPIRDWIKEEPFLSSIKECFESCEAAEFFERNYLRTLLDKHISGKRDCWREIWCVYVFLIWYKEYFCYRM